MPARVTLPAKFPHDSQDIIRTHVLTKFHEELTTNKQKDKLSAPGGNIFKQTWTIFTLIRDIIKTNVLTTFHEDWIIQVVLKEKSPPPTGGQFVQPTVNLFELVQDTIGENLLTKFQEDRTINVASTLLTGPQTDRQTDRQCENYIPPFIRKGAKKCNVPGGHVF
ncbi:hypothetical protein DPMN_110383 [Dreissena polymorpha]|uniref:Uncharacterized protein n=1 Tax=Dreissena polymorpha TaxID=45954 RepID=A0A9D4KBY0_DREPO|nr:hypothetical protein DPMN_110383 [Dreissena polymorpha]